MSMYDWEEYHRYEDTTVAEVNTFCLNCTVVGETDKSYRLLLEDFNVEGWFPKKLVTHEGDGNYNIPEWLIIKLAKGE